MLVEFGLSPGVQRAIQVIGQLVQKLITLHWHHLHSPSSERSGSAGRATEVARAATAISLLEYSTPARPPSPPSRGLPRPGARTPFGIPPAIPEWCASKCPATLPGCTSAPDWDSNPQPHGATNHLRSLPLRPEKPCVPAFSGATSSALR